jgi:FKBP-type peptidyl-prolyl cis-trans isomerase FkpA
MNNGIANCWQKGIKNKFSPIAAINDTLWSYNIPDYICKNSGNMKKILIGSLIAFVLFNSCVKNHDSQPTCDPNYDACASPAPASEVIAVENYLNTKAITGATKHCSGMYYKIDSAGTGSSATVCSYVYVKYKGQLTNDTVFEDQSGAPVAFFLGDLIKGFKNGIPLIRPGGTIHLYVPPSLAYGNQQVGNIPANSILIFQISLVAVQ